MEIEEYLTQLEIPFKGEYKEGKYVIILKDSEQFMSIYSKLEKNENLYQEDSGIIQSDDTSLYYVDKENDKIINLSADFTNNEYKLVILHN